MDVFSYLIPTPSQYENQLKIHLVKLPKLRSKIRHIYYIFPIINMLQQVIEISSLAMRKIEIKAF
jgi:hypothetical protein